MDGGHRTERLSAGQVARLIEAHGLEVAPTSPLAPFANLAPGADEGTVGRGLLDAGGKTALAVLAAPDRQVRTIIPGPTDTLVQLYYGRADAPETGLVGCWLEGDRMRVSFPWNEEDVAAVAARVVLPTLPSPAEEPDLVVSVAGLAALAAAIDAVRSRLFVSLAERNPAVEARFDREEIRRQAEAGASSSDARWLVTLLRVLAPPYLPVPADPIGSGFEELVAAGLIQSRDGRWTPSPALFGYATRWANPLPAVAHEVIETAGPHMTRYGYRIALRGGGPLTVIDFEDVLSEPRVTLRTVDPIRYLDDLVGLLQPGPRPEADIVAVGEPIVTRDPRNPSLIVGMLQPGRRYLVKDRQRGWALVADTDGPLEGWAPEEPLQPVGAPPPSAIGERVWVATHTAPAGGMPGWAEPNPAVASVAAFDEGTGLQLVERRADWALVRAADGREAWVDGRRLTPVAVGPEPPPPPPPPDESIVLAPGAVVSAPAVSARADVIRLLAVVVLVVSAFLPWRANWELSPFETSATFLWNVYADTGWFSIGLLTLLLGLVASTTLFVGRMRQYRRVIGGVAVGLGALWLIETIRYLGDYWGFWPLLGALFTQEFAAGPWLALAAGLVLLLKRR